MEREQFVIKYKRIEEVKNKLKYCFIIWEKRHGE